MTLRDKVAIVTGAAQGIGKAYAETLAREGAAVAVVDIKGDKALEVANAITAGGGRAIAISTDVSNAEQVEEMCRAAARDLGGLDILVNNAAIYEGYVSHPLEEVPIDYWNRFLDVNVTSVLLCSRAAVPYMRERGKGKIVNQSSDAAQACNNQYGVSKLLVQGLTVGFAQALARDNITVNAVSPGPIDTEATRGKYPGEQENVLKSRIPLGRMGTVEDVSEFLAYIVSDRADWITGQIFRIDGGFWMRPA
jgi:3-oxoacyl-[acyl-carrier protein] reductase